MTIGSDVEPATSGDMFSAMRLTMNVQRNIDNLNALSRNGSLPETSSISCSEALQWITINAARMIKKENVTGTIEPGKKADIIIIRGEDLNLFPINNAVNAVVRYANPGNVDTVIVDGKVVKRNGKLLFKDISVKKEILLESSQRILSDMGFQT